MSESARKHGWSEDPDWVEQDGVWRLQKGRMTYVVTKVENGFTIHEEKAGCVPNSVDHYLNSQRSLGFQLTLEDAQLSAEGQADPGLYDRLYPKSKVLTRTANEEAGTRMFLVTEVVLYRVRAESEEDAIQTIIEDEERDEKYFVSVEDRYAQPE